MFVFAERSTSGLSASSMPYCQPSAQSATLRGKKEKKRATKAKKAETKRRNEIEDIAREAVCFNCDCKKLCLSHVGDTATESIAMMADYMIPWINMSKKEHRHKFFAILEGCASGVTAGGHLEKT